MPTLAVAESIKNKYPQAELLYVGSKRREDAALVTAFGLTFRAISTGKLRRYFDLENFFDFGRVLKGFFQSVGIIRKFKPDVIFAKGGFVSVPMILAARFTKTPFVAHESDAVIGLANRLGFVPAKMIATAFPVEVYPAKFRNKLQYVGLPMTKSMLITRALQPLSGERPLIVIMGGSQGAFRINQLIWEILPELLTKYDVLHQVGTTGFADGEKKKNDLSPEVGMHYQVVSFDPNLRNYIQAADLVITRAGSSLHEIAAWAKPVLAIPLSGSASNHQAVNAGWFLKNGAVVVLPQENLTGATLLAKIDQLMENDVERERLANNIAKLGQIHRTAADTLADLIVKQVK